LGLAGALMTLSTECGEATVNCSSDRLDNIYQRVTLTFPGLETHMLKVCFSRFPVPERRKRPMGWF
jgi:hypothetical protein